MKGHDMMRVADKICLVTGGAMGIGLAEARALAQEGARVVISDVNVAAGEAAAREIGPDAIFCRLDVTDEENWRAVIAQTVAHFGGLNVLVNNAAVLEMADVETCTMDSWRRIHEVSAEGTFLGIKYALRAIRATGTGSIINTASSAALQEVPPVAE
jgi:3(or 17)beta-hydroxysteroid dehydrogenase